MSLLKLHLVLVAFIASSVHATCLATSGSLSSNNPPAGVSYQYEGSPGADVIMCDNNNDVASSRAEVNLGDGADTLTIVNAPRTEENPINPNGITFPAYGAVDGDFSLFFMGGGDVTGGNDTIEIDLGSTVEQVYGDRFMGFPFNPTGGNIGGNDSLSVSGESTVGFLSGESFWTNLGAGAKGGDDELIVNNATISDSSAQYGVVIGEEFLAGQSGVTVHSSGNDKILIENGAQVKGDILGEIYKYTQNVQGSETVTLYAGNDDITIDNSTVTGSIYGEAYADSEQIIGHIKIDNDLTYNNFLYEKGGVVTGNDTVTLTGSNTHIDGGIYLFNGNDIVNYTSGVIGEVIDGGDDKDNSLDNYTDRFNLVGVAGITISNFGGVTEAQLLNFEEFALTKGTEIDYEATYNSPKYLKYIVDESSTATMTNAGQGMYNIDSVSTVNNGVISLSDDKQGDKLTVSGGYTGNGQLLVDVNTTQQQADMLFVGGDTTGSKTEIVPTFLTPNVTQSYEVPIVEVVGTTSLGDFTFLGGATTITENGVRYDLILDGKVWKIRATIPVIGIAKSASVPTDNGDGTFTTTISLKVENLGNDILKTVSITDVLASSDGGTFGTYSATLATLDSYKVTNLSATGLNVTTSFTGAGSNLTLATGKLATDATATVSFDITFKPSAQQTSYENQAVATSTGEQSGKQTSDLSDDGAVVDANSNGNPNEVGENDKTPLNVILRPALSLLKIATPNSGLKVGDTVSYTITATNSGNVTLTNVVVKDDKLGTEKTCASVAPTKTCVLTGEYTVTQDDVNAGKIGNTATATSTQTPTPVETTHTVALTQTSKLEIVKTAKLTTDKDGNGKINVSDTLTYTVTATNAGNVTLTNVVVTDDKLGTDKTCASVAPSKTCVLTGEYTVTQDDVNAGKIDNTATATSTQTPTPVDTKHTVALTQTSKLEIVKTAKLTTDKDGNGKINVGDTLTYTVTTTNTGNVTLTNVVVTDDKIGTEKTCDSVAPTKTCILTGEYSVTQDDVNSGKIDNNATVQSSETPTPVEVKNTVSLTQTPKLEIRKTASPNSGLKVGDTVTYTVTATNAGNVTLTNVVVKDDKLGTEKTCDSVAPTKTCVLTGVYVVTKTDMTVGRVINQAEATALEVTEPVVTSLTLPVKAHHPVIGVAKAFSDLVSNADGSYQVSTTITVINLGDENLTQVTVREDLNGLPVSGHYLGNPGFGRYEDSSLAGTYIVSDVTSETLTVSSDFNGDNQQQIAVGELAVGETATITYRLRFVPAFGQTIFDAQAFARGVGIFGDVVSDSSNDLVVDENGNGKANDPDEDTPSRVKIGSSLAVTQPIPSASTWALILMTMMIMLSSLKTVGVRCKKLHKPN